MTAAGRCAAQGREGGGFAAAHLPARRAGYGATPPVSRVLRIALRATALRAALARRPRRPPEPGRAVRPGACPGPRRAGPPSWRAAADTRTPANK
jgi:hypothetical protein